MAAPKCVTLVLALALAAAIVAAARWVWSTALPSLEQFQRKSAPANTMLAISEAYIRTLNRAPTSGEIAATTSRLQTDPGFSLGVLETSLMMSPERRRYAATQTNALRTDLEGVFTQGHVRLHVRAVHADLTGSAPSPEAEAFLVDRYVASELDEHALMRAVRAINVGGRALR